MDGLEELVTCRLRRHGFDVEVRYSEAPGHCRELAREAVERGFHTVVAAGGDGTVNEVADALKGSPVIMGIIPRGSGNGLARHISQSIDIDKALRIICDGHWLPCDYGTANGLPFFCTFGLGFDAAVSESFSSMKRRGLNSYIRSALKEYLRFTPKEYEIITGGQTITVKAFIIAVCNASQYGNNAYIAPEASLSDGLLDITIVHAGNPVTRAMAGVDLFTGYINRNVLSQTLRVTDAIIRQKDNSDGSAMIQAHLDGDPVTISSTVEVQCHPARLRIFIDNHEAKFHPILTPIRSMHFDLWFHIRSLMRRLRSRIHL